MSALQTHAAWHSFASGWGDLETLKVPVWTLNALPAICGFSTCRRVSQTDTFLTRGPYSIFCRSDFLLLAYLDAEQVLDTPLGHLLGAFFPYSLLEQTNSQRR